MKEITIIPDVHGRSFWRPAVLDVSLGSKIVFLGDYLDPYPWEGITPEESTRMLREIIDLKRERQDDVVLLLGNHDMGYLDPDINFCRRDHFGALRNRRILEDNLDLFQITHVEKVAGSSVLFTHAGVALSWLDRHRDVLGDGPFDPEALNAMLHDPARRGVLYTILAEAAFMRGGDSPSGSPIWADMDEYLAGERLLPGYVHLFGHSMHEGRPAPAGNNGICLDCLHAFLLKDEPLTLTMLG
jgi:hypothetical protein